MKSACSRSFLLRSMGLALLPVAATASTADGANEPNRPPNILFIAIDDLRNDLGILGVDHARTPHLDAFAQKSRLFSHHYVQVPSCGPSRAALLSGMRPSSTEHLPNTAILNTGAEWGDRNLPAWFRRHGWKTLALGKISHHPGGLTGQDWAEGPEELPGAWDRHWVPESPWKTPLAMMHGFANGLPRERGVSPAWEAHDGPDTAYPDAWVASEAMETLSQLANQEQPWFFAVGFFKPHLPFAAPRRWFDIHNPEHLPTPANTGAHPPPSSWHPSRELMGNYHHNGRDPRADPAYAAQLRHAYAAATSYVDDQIGRLLTRLAALPVAENTIVVIWSDHGFNLGEHGIWGKHSLYEESLRSPLMIWHPGLPGPGLISHAVVEAVDLFPTLTELAGIPSPAGLDGHSLMPQLRDPATPSAKPALAWTGRGQVSIRTPHWRLIRHRPDGEAEAFELFDFRRHPRGERIHSPSREDIPSELLESLARVPSFN